MAKKAPRRVFELRLTLDDAQPEVWRRMRVKSSMHLNDLAYAIMIIFRMQGSHLYNFTQTFHKDPDKPRQLLPGRGESFEDTTIKRYELPMDDAGIDGLDVRDYTLTKVFADTDTLDFTYDFGDSWQFKIEVIKRLPSDKLYLPRVLDCKGFGIVEDAGGVYGLAHMIEVLRNPDDDEYEDIKGWLQMNNISLADLTMDISLRRVLNAVLDYVDDMKRRYER
ncbi:hypothetical protein AYR62_13585 [Secundilactobacillus paracollinoides]|uniref:plasmid pRiA4b ORF-3 family protein n=1 Tax=Secundilactobacillus paracollinoides TaxID=240427 RepID=UPI00081A75F6|nr:plasmid pRiA4b ORF-3 family protein [Secundilactobacillus paracollinoides]ANZ65007.1 hypothetical protein AYR62_13585 [Secundilactobacillus paracollinoides]